MTITEHVHTGGRCPECARFIVIRSHPHCPPGYVPQHLEGLWFTRATGDGLPPLSRIAAGASATAYATGRLEYRDSDGEAAEVFEIPPPGQAGYPERVAWQVCDGLGYLRAAWQHRLSTAELAALGTALEAVRREANTEAAERR